jgi:uncharacterized membrane protein
MKQKMKTIFIFFIIFYLTISGESLETLNDYEDLEVDYIANGIAKWVAIELNNRENVYYYFTLDIVEYKMKVVDKDQVDYKMKVVYLADDQVDLLINRN